MLKDLSGGDWEESMNRMKMIHVINDAVAQGRIRVQSSAILGSNKVRAVPPLEWTSKSRVAYEIVVRQGVQEGEQVRFLLSGKTYGEACSRLGHDGVQTG